MREVKRRLQIFLILFVLVTASGTLGFMVLENIPLADAFYYNIVTMSTVGYGDIHPTNQASKMFAVLLIIMGGTTFIGVIANATEIIILRREEKSRIKKVNMVLGLFFSEVGCNLLAIFAMNDPNLKVIENDLLIRADWTEQNFINALKKVEKHKFRVDSHNISLNDLSESLVSKRDFLLNLLENPVLIEHENFSDTLLSVFHIHDELSCRQNKNSLPEPDLNHLSIDINRAYKNIMKQWVIYMRHLKSEYPYLFSLAMRKNPFDNNASPIFTK